jgi:hypothetical protein
MNVGNIHSNLIESILFCLQKSIQNNVEHMCSCLKVTCFGLDIGCHQDKKNTVIKRQVEDARYKTLPCFIWDFIVKQKYCKPVGACM